MCFNITGTKNIILLHPLDKVWEVQWPNGYFPWGPGSLHCILGQDTQFTLTVPLRESWLISCEMTKIERWQIFFFRFYAFCIFIFYLVTLIWCFGSILSLRSSFFHSNRPLMYSDLSALVSHPIFRNTHRQESHKCQPDWPQAQMKTLPFLTLISSTFAKLCYHH